MYIISNQERQEVSNWSVISKKTKIIDQSSACWQHYFYGLIKEDPPQYIDLKEDRLLRLHPIKTYLVISQSFDSK